MKSYAISEEGLMLREEIEFATFPHEFVVPSDRVMTAIHAADDGWITIRQPLDEVYDGMDVSVHIPPESLDALIGYLIRFKSRGQSLQLESQQS